MRLQDICNGAATLTLNQVAQDADLVKQIQIRLRDLQMPIGEPDGHCGPLTSAAIARFCKAFNATNDDLSPEIAKQLIQAKTIPNCNPLLEMLTPGQVAGILDCPLSDVQTYLAGVLEAFHQRNILNRPTLIAAIATIGVETGGFRPIHEWGGNAYFTEMYENREDLGNIYPGDGARYHGRGFVQITGRANYRDYGQKLGCPLEDDPDLALDPTIAAEILALYFDDRAVHIAAQKNDWEQVRRAVNGGLNGWDEFINFVKRSQTML
jgi:hypothetical protein